jgi:hypothetical protein
LSELKSSVSPKFNAPSEGYGNLAIPEIFTIGGGDLSSINSNVLSFGQKIQLVLDFVNRMFANATPSDLEALKNYKEVLYPKFKLQFRNFTNQVMVYKLIMPYAKDFNMKSSIFSNNIKQLTDEVQQEFMGGGAPTAGGALYGSPVMISNYGTDAEGNTIIQDQQMNRYSAAQVVIAQGNDLIALTQSLISSFDAALSTSSDPELKKTLEIANNQYKMIPKAITRDIMKVQILLRKSKAPAGFAP